MNTLMSEQSLQRLHPDLFSSIRRALNSLKEKQLSQRKSALQQLLKIITSEQLPATLFEEIGHMAIKDVLKCFTDHSEMCRQIATNIVIQILPRSARISSFLPYIFSILVDRVNCHDLQGISNLPQKMRPPPGQKPKVLIKIVQNCEQIRVLYCNLLRKIAVLLEHEGDEIRKYLDDLINVTRALIMDPAPEVQKMACQTLQLVCKLYKDLLLHYTELMGRAVLLPLISKKSKIRIAGLRTLNAILWCGLYKYNAFVFQNLIGFKDPNSVPIKDFYEPSHNINYLATFITDPNNKVRIEFMKSIKMWVCDLNDKYDHHGKLVPYLLSGLFDQDQQVKETALQAIEQIGRQIETERQKDFRQGKQFAIDAKWTWDGKLVDLPVTAPLKGRPSLGSRFFIRGHVRKFWSALYRQVRDIKIENRYRACNLAVYGVIYTENYLTQYLDSMIPQLITAVISHQKEEVECCKMIEKIFFYIGRYCEQSSYLHIMKSALEGKLVQNEEFIKASLIALSRIVQGSLQAVPEGEGLCHKKQQVIDLLSMIVESGAMEEIYSYNCHAIQEFAEELLKGLQQKGKKEEIEEIFSEHFVTILKLWSVGYYEENYLHCFKLETYQSQTVQNQLIGTEGQEQGKPTKIKQDRLIQTLSTFQSLYQQNFMDFLQEYLSEVYQNPPSLMDSDFKLVIVLSNYLIKQWSSNGEILFSLTKEIISESLSFNRSVEILNFSFKYICWIWDQKSSAQTQIQRQNSQNQLTSVTQTEQSLKMYKQLSHILERCMSNLNKFKPQKAVASYDQHLLESSIKQESDIRKINEDTFLILFKNASEAFRKFYLNKTPLTNSVLGQIFESYIELCLKMRRSQEGTLQSIKTLWVVFERENVNEDFPKKIVFEDENKSEVKVLPKVIDFLMERIETLGEPEHKKVSMLFSTLDTLLKCFPVFSNAATALPLIYPDYNDWFEKLIRYAIDEKDVELKQKFVDLLRKASKKMRPWFEMQYKMSLQGQKFIKADLLKKVLNI